MAEENLLSRTNRKLLSKRQFGLLSLLVIVSGAALGTQFWLVPLLRQRAREAILQRIESVGGQWADIPVDPMKRRLLLSGSKVDDELLIEIARKSRSLPELTQLDLFQTIVTEKGLEAITTGVDQVKHMVVFENKFDDGAIEAVLLRRKDLKIERRTPDPVASGLAMASIPRAALISLISVGSNILAGAGDGRLHVLDAEGNLPRKTIAMHENWLFDLSVSPSGKMLATAGGDNQLAIWSYPELAPVSRITAHTGDLHGVVWLDESHLATVSDDRTLAMWELKNINDSVEVQTAELIRKQSILAHEKAIPRIRASLDRRTLVTTSRDDRLMVWNVDENLEIRQTAKLEGHMDDCMDVQISPDGQFAMSVGYDGALMTWDLSTGKLVKRDQVSEGRLFCLEVDWQRRLAFVGTPTGVIEVDYVRGKSRAVEDQIFVARIFKLEHSMLSSDGMGNLYARTNRDLSPFKKASIFEASYDHYSDNFIRNWTSADIVPTEQLRMARSSYPDSGH